MFGTSESRIGYLAFNQSHHHTESRDWDSANQVLHVIDSLVSVHSPYTSVTAIRPADGEHVWIAFSDGTLKRFDVGSASCDFSANIGLSDQGVFVTCMTTKHDILFCGMSTGLITVFHVPTTRQITVLQGPPTGITSLCVNGNSLYATHSCGLMDSIEGSNSVQPWDVSDILTRGTQKLPLWGPVTGSCTAANPLESDKIVVVSSAGILHVIKNCDPDQRLKTEFIINTNPISLLDKNCLTVMEGKIFVASENCVKIFSIPNGACEVPNYLDISYLDVCESIELGSQSVSTMPPAPKIAEYVPANSDDEDLRSWARG